MRSLTAIEEEKLPLLTLARGDETSIPAHAQVKKTHTGEDVEQDIFYKGRNFR